MARLKKTAVCPLAGTGVGGQQKTFILFHLLSGPKRLSELQRLLPGASRQMLTIQLRDLENVGAIARTCYPEQPPRVDYALTELSQRSGPMLRQFVAWGEWFCAQVGLDYEDWLARMGSRWKVWIWYCLLDGSKRFGELQRQLPSISRQALSRELRELERLGAVRRGASATGEPWAEYALTDLGGSAAPIIRQLMAWGRWYCDEASLPFDWPLSIATDEHTALSALTAHAPERRAVS